MNRNFAGASMPASEDWCGFPVAVPHIDWAALLESMRLKAGGGGGRGGGGVAAAAAMNSHVTQTNSKVAANVQLGAGVEVSADTVFTTLDYQNLWDFVAESTSFYIMNR